MRGLAQQQVKVLIVDDSLFMRKYLADVLSEIDAIEVVGVAVNGSDALDKISVLSPQVVLLDIKMPVMDGMECLRIIRQRYPEIAVLMHSNLPHFDADIIIRTLEAGAVDFIEKPANADFEEWLHKRAEYSEKICTAASFGKGKINAANRVQKHQEHDIINDGAANARYIAIGISTGGPRALQELLSGIQQDFDSSLLIVQHMPAGYTATLAERLNMISRLTVKEAENGESVKRKHAYLAPGDCHMSLKKTSGGSLTIQIDKAPPVGGHRPSFNVLLDSFPQAELRDLAVVFMTGMGSDGTDAMRRIKQKNSKIFVIAQDEASSVVHGMPGSAIRAGLVDKVAPLHELAGLLNQIGRAP